MHIVFSKEPILLDTGGGVKNAARVMGDDPYYVLSGDGYWTDGPNASALQRMADFWDEDKMDILILLQPVTQMTLTRGVGDYDLQDDGKAVRSHDKTGAYMFTSMRIIVPTIFRGSPDGPFSFLDLMDKAEQNGRLYGLVHDGTWEHISTPTDVERVSNAIAKKDAV